MLDDTVQGTREDNAAIPLVVETAAGAGVVPGPTEVVQTGEGQIWLPILVVVLGAGLALGVVRWASECSPLPLPGVTQRPLHSLTVLIVTLPRGRIGSGRLPVYPKSSPCSAAFLATRSAC